MAQPYPSSHYAVPMSNPNQQPPRNMYRLNTAQANAGAGYAYSYNTPQSGHFQHQDMQFGLVTPPTTTPAQFGSPLIANGNYSPMPGSAPHTPWGMNALSLSPLPSDGGFSYAPSPMMASDCGGTSTWPLLSLLIRSTEWRWATDTSEHLVSTAETSSAWTSDLASSPLSSEPTDSLPRRSKSGPELHRPVSAAASARQG